MDFLNKALAQLTDLVKSMTPAARITAGLLLAVVVISLVYLFTSHLSGPDTHLMGGVPFAPSDVRAMEVAFANAGLSDYKIEGARIRVPRAQQNAYIGALAEAKALPADFNTALDEALLNTSVFMNKDERQQRLKIAKQKTLGLIISSMKGIERAYVLFDTEVKSGLRREKLTTATATVKSCNSQPLDEGQIASIRYLVAGAIAGLKPENVTVADLNGATSYGSPENGPGGTGNVYVLLKRTHEQQWTNKILNALAYVEGVKVTTNVVLDRQKLSRSTSTKFDSKPTAVRETDESSSRTQSGGGPGGRPGFASQQPNTAQRLAGGGTAGSQQEQEESRREVLSVPNSETTEKELIGLTPTRVSVSIGIPSSYFEKVWQQQHPAADGQQPSTPDAAELDQIRQTETTNIRTCVAALLPEAEGVENGTDLVTVSMFPHLPGEAIPEPGLTQNVTVWLSQYWSTLGLLGVAVFSLVILRSMVKATPVTRERSDAPRLLSAERERAEPGEQQQEALTNRLARFSGSGRSLRDELSELVQEDPDAAANILRTWIGAVN